MKNATFFRMMALLCWIGGVMATQGQDVVTFEQNRDFRDQVGWPVHRGCPIVADFDNDRVLWMYITVERLVRMVGMPWCVCSLQWGWYFFW